MKENTLLICILAACSGSALAADDQTKSTVPTVSDILDASGISLTGYFDVAYNKMNSTGLFTSAPTGPVSGGLAGNSHIFDTPGATQGKNFNSFNLQQLSVIASMLPKEGVGGLVNLTTGQDAATVASAGLGAAAAGSNNSSHTFDVTQAYVSYATGSLTVIGGKFATLAGAELITSPSNKNYSRAWMFGWGPYTHTGLRATYVINDMFSLIGGVNNGWDQVNSTASGKTAELGFTITPNSMFSLATSYYQGKEVAATVGARKYLDMVGTLNATDKLNFVFDYADGSQENATLTTGLNGTAKWNSLAIYANYQINDAWRVSYRNENFDDKDGYRSSLTYTTALGGTGVLGNPVAQRLKSNTFTVGFMPIKHLELRGEVRLDKSSRNAFLQSDGTGKNTQNMFALQAVYQF